MLFGHIAEDPVEPFFNIGYRQASYLTGEPAHPVTQIPYDLKSYVRIFKNKLFKLGPAKSTRECIFETNGTHWILAPDLKNYFHRENHHLYEYPG